MHTTQAPGMEIISYRWLRHWRKKPVRSLDLHTRCYVPRAPSTSRDYARSGGHRLYPWGPREKSGRLAKGHVTRMHYGEWIPQRTILPSKAFLPSPSRSRASNTDTLRTRQGRKFSPFLIVAPRLSRIFIFFIHSCASLSARRTLKPPR